MNETEVLDTVFSETQTIVNEVDFLSFLVNGLTGSMDYTIGRSVDDRGVLLTLVIDKSLAGRVIGKAGVTATAIRSLLHALGTKNDARYSLYIEVKDE